MLAYWKTLQEALILYICFPMRHWMTTYLSLELQVHLNQCSFVDFIYYFFFYKKDLVSFVEMWFKQISGFASTLI